MRQKTLSQAIDNILSALIAEQENEMRIEDFHLAKQSKKQLLKIETSIAKQNKLGLNILLEDLTKDDSSAIKSDDF